MGQNDPCVDAGLFLCVCVSLFSTLRFVVVFVWQCVPMVFVFCFLLFVFFMFVLRIHVNWLLTTLSNWLIFLMKCLGMFAEIVAKKSSSRWSVDCTKEIQIDMPQLLFLH